MIFISNHLLNGALGMSQSHVLSEFLVWVPLWCGMNGGSTLWGKKSLQHPPLENTSKSKLGSSMLLSKKLKVR